MNDDIPFEPILPPDRVFDISRKMRERCPVAHVPADGGFWVVSDYAGALDVLQARTFVMGGEPHLRIPADPPGFRRPLMPPQTSDPPLHRQFRVLLNPYLSPVRLQRHEPGIRRIIGELIETFDPDGRCELATQFAKVFPSLITFEELFGIIDRAETARARGWLTRILYDMHREDPVVLAGLQTEWNEWVRTLMARRRNEPRRDDLIDAVLFGTVAGRPLTDEEAQGAIQILTLGGFLTTADATCNLVVALIEQPELQDRLREDPSLIAPFIEEVLRLEPPVTSRPRRCALTAEVRGTEIPVDARVMVNLVAANRDPSEFDRPDELDLDRKQNRHLSFGAGIHRCIGSNVARLSLRIVLEELLSRLADIRYADGAQVQRHSAGGNTWRLVTSMPITFRSIAADPARASVRRVQG